METKMSLMRIIDIYGGEHYLNVNAIAEFDPHVPNLELAVAIELINGRRILVHKSVADKIIGRHGEIVFDFTNKTARDNGEADG